MNLKNNIAKIVKNLPVSDSAPGMAARLAALRRRLLSRKGWKALVVIGVLLALWLSGMLDSLADVMNILTSPDFDPSVLAAAALPAVAGVTGASRNIDGEPLTTAIVETEAPGLLRSEIDSRIVKIRPMSTPLDQISRYGGARQCRSMKVEYYSVDTKPVTVKLTAAWTSRATLRPRSRSARRGCSSAQPRCSFPRSNPPRAILSCFMSPIPTAPR